MSEIIELDDVSKRYDGELAVDGLTLSVREGELLVLLGGSGSGKTTTLKLINRLIEPTSGRVRVQGEDVSQVTPYELRRRIGYVFQRLGLFPHMTVAENIGITPSLLGWDEKRIGERVGELLEMLELDASLRDRKPSELSGGQQQRVGVARALAARPRVMLLDEPFGALDPLTRERLQQALLRIRDQVGLTAIFVTHDMLEALLIGDRIAVMHEGKLAQEGTPRELVQRPADTYVEQLVGTPKRQADSVEGLIENESTADDSASGGASR